MTAINERGLIGKVIQTTSKNSRILLLTDPNLSISIKTISMESSHYFQELEITNIRLALLLKMIKCLNLEIL